MTPDVKSDETRKRHDRPFPWPCANCLKDEVYPVTMPYDAEVKHDGRTYKLALPALTIPKCRSCGELVFSNSVDDQIMQALRREVRLLTPQQIKAGRKSLGLKSKELAERLGVAAATLSRWEKGMMIQSRAMDNLLRVYFAVPEARAALQGVDQDVTLGASLYSTPQIESTASDLRVEAFPMTTLGVLDLLGLCGFDRKCRAELVRHSNDKDPATRKVRLNPETGTKCTIEELLSRNWLELYQSYQGKSRFHKLEYIVSFYALPGSRSCFFGAFEVCGHRPASEGDAPSDCPWVRRWQEECSYFYDLRRLPGYEIFEKRLVIDWEKGARNWHQQLSNMPALEWLPAGRRLPQFKNYSELSLSYQQLTELYKTSEAHSDWREALKAVAGVYLILADDQDRGIQYVGSASGASGIWGRWGDYAKSGHGGNKLLRKLIAEKPDVYPKCFRFSVLEVLPKTLARQEVLNHEALYKQKLGTRAHGLNT